MDRNDENEEKQNKVETGDDKAKSENINSADLVDKNEQYYKAMGAGCSHKTNQNHSKSNSSSNKTIKIRPRPQSRSLKNRTATANPFLIFLQEFRRNYSGMRSAKLFKLAGERWKQMSAEQKQPYIEAAKRIKLQRGKQKRKRPRSKSDTSTERNNSDDQKKTRKKRSPKTKKESDSDATSFTSATVDTGTSEDVSE